MKKFFAFLLLACFCLTWLGGCSEEPAKPSEQESSAAQETTPTPEPTATAMQKPVKFDEQEYKGMKFSVPTDWNKTENADNVVFVTSYKDSSLLSLSISEFDSEVDVTDSTFRSGYLIGLSSIDGYEAISTGDITIAGKAGFEHCFLAESSGKKFDTTFYGIAKGNKLVGFIFGISSDADDAAKGQFENDIEAILDSIDLSALSSDDVTLSRVEALSSAAAPEETTTMGERNALKKAKSYLSLMPFSYSGLISQLEYEGYTTDESTYGADNCGADWNEQAALKAQSYIDMTEFSRQGLIDQLVYEGFTQEQAEYGVTAVGY